MGETTEVRLRVGSDDLVVRHRADARVGDLVDALRARLPSAEDGACTTLRLADGTTPSPISPLASLGLRHGDHVAPAAAVDEPAAAPSWWELIGPDRGQGRWPARLGPGEYRVGRDELVNEIVLDDESVSRRHAVLAFDAEGSFTVADSGSRNGTTVEGDDLSFGDVTVQLVRRSPRTRLWSAPPPMAETVEAGGATVQFHRPPRITEIVPTVTIELPEAPVTPPRQRLPWLSAAVPALMAVVVVAAASMGGGSLGGSFVWMSAAFLLMSPIMIVAGHVETRRTARVAARRLRREFAEASAVAQQAVVEAIEAERAARVARYPGTDELRRRVRVRDLRLWTDAGIGAIALRVGSATLPSSVRTERSATRGDADVERELDALADLAAIVPACPVSVELGEVGALAIVGPGTAVNAAARAVMLQAAVRVPPSELELLVVTSTTAASDWDWVKWLPGGRPGARSWPARVVVDAAASTEVVDRLRGPSTLVVIDRSAPLGAVAVAEVLAACRGVGAAALWLGDDVAGVPAECGAQLEVRPRVGEGSSVASGRLTIAASGSVIDGIALDVVTPPEADEWARELSPLLEVVPVGGGVSLDDEVGLAEVLFGAGLSVDDVDLVESRWRDDDGSLGAPVGRSGGGTVVVDLRTDGPHGIVAGTTGAGKSEFLQTLVVSLAASHPPSRVTFLLVDYKGGAAFGDCVDLPHTVGLVTDLDDLLVGRVLTSLAAELRRRERLVAAAGVKDLAEMERGGHPDTPPSLVIVVDEFASLVAEVPGFVDGMVDIARRGRSLGVHLLLATQRPAGVVDDHLRANANLRIALRVADAGDSTDVIGIGDAAAIPRSVPGRAVLRVGEGDVIAFRSAYGGARRPETTAGEERSCGAAPSRSGARARRTPLVEVEPFLAVRTPSAAWSAAIGPTDLQRLVATIGRAATARREPRPRRPWCEPLPAVIPFGPALETWQERRPCSGGGMLLGVADDPAAQSQYLLDVDLDACGSIGLFGSGAVPRTAVQSMVTSAIVGRSPDGVRVDVVTVAPSDFCGLASFPHVGSVIDVEDMERVRRLMEDLRVGLRRRDRRRLLVLDNVGVFVSRFDQLDGGATTDLLARLVSEGRQAGIHVVLTADRRNAVPMAVAAGIGERVVMAMASPEEYLALGVDGGGLAVGPLDDPTGQGSGRALVRGLMVQTLTLDAEGPGSVAALADVERERWPGRQATPIGVLPATVDARMLIGAEERLTCTGGLPALVGLDDATLAPAYVDLADGHLLVAGPGRSGRSSALATMAASLGPEVRRVLLSARSSRFSERSTHDAMFDLVLGGGAESLDELEHFVADAGAVESQPVVLFVDDVTDLDEPVDAALESLLVASRHRPLHVVAAAESSLARSTYGGLLVRLRRERRALLLQPDVELDGDLAGVRLPRRGQPAVVPGRGELVERGLVRRVQVAVLGGEWGTSPMGSPDALSYGDHAAVATVARHRSTGGSH
ncbi:MAG: FtsK/SpoIIIE domain-containing protein [Acidimicrobiales bacterium]